MQTCLLVCACKFLVVPCASFLLHVRLVPWSKETPAGIIDVEKTNLKVKQARVGSLKISA